MVFSSVVFLFYFLPVFMAGYILLPSSARPGVIVLGSLAFYGWGDPAGIFLLLAFILFNWLMGIAIGRAAVRDAQGGARGGRDARSGSRGGRDARSGSRGGRDARSGSRGGRDARGGGGGRDARGGGGGRGAWLAAGCAVNLGVLLVAKYRGFLVEQATVGFAALGFLHPALLSPAFAAGTTPVALPLGVSFFTFQGISYLVDVSRGVVPAQSSLLKFAMYKAMFPQLIAGPIVRYSQIADEIDDRSLHAGRLALGVQLFVVGLAQKVLVANTVAVAADAIFAQPAGQLTLTTAWLGAACYTIQIYFDFGGYSTMAIGLGHMLGFGLPCNFRDPYLARSMTDFWRRWHITLSSWFRDYLYVPLGGNRRGGVRTYANLLLVFVLCGLWHGAAWTFAVWGLYHGAFLIAERLCGGMRLPRALWPLRHLYVVLAVMVGWVVFRAASLGDALRYLATMAGLGHPGIESWPAARFATPSVLAALAAAVLIVVAPATRLPALAGRPASPLAAAAWDAGMVGSLLALFALSAVALSGGTYNPFIYFRF